MILVLRVLEWAPEIQTVAGVVHEHWPRREHLPRTLAFVADFSHSIGELTPVMVVLKV